MPFTTLGSIQSFIQSTLSGQIIVLVLLLGSIFAWTAMLNKRIQFGRVRGKSLAFLKSFRDDPHPLGVFVRQQRFSDTPVYKVYLRACQAATRVLDLTDIDPSELFMRGLQGAGRGLTQGQLEVIREAGERELAEQVLHLEHDMTWLATITSTAPFLGLLGTVMGVMEAFNGMAVTGTPTLSAVAPGISAALLTTVVGLLVAIPSTIGYNLLSRRLREEAVAMDNFVQELVGEFQIAYPLGREG